MATSIATHCKMGIVDATGNVTMIYPQTTGADVIIRPNSVVSATTVQGLVETLKDSAFISDFLGIDDESNDSETHTYSIKKINTKLPFNLKVEDGTYGYLKDDDTFVPFKSQADIDSAVAAAKQGTAQAGDVLSGRTFTNSTTSGISGSMANNGAFNKTLDIATPSIIIPEGFHSGSGEVKIVPQTKSITPNEEVQIVTPDDGKVLSSVEVAAGVSKHTETYRPTANSTTNDMGEFHNNRYVDTTTVYNLGVNTVLNQSFKIPNLIPCIRIISDYYQFHTYFQLKLIAGVCTTKLRPGLGSSGSSGRPDQFDSNWNSETGPDPSYGYHNGHHTYDGFTDPGVTFGTPYADFCFYNVNDVRTCVLYIGYNPTDDWLNT
jgi:hypothetical protein